MLPTCFRWIDRYQYAKGELALLCGDRYVAQLMKKVDGVSWYAQLFVGPGSLSPCVFRDCESKESGIAGIEAWACRHEAALRENRHLYPQELGED